MAPFLDGKELVVLMQDDFDNMVENNEEDIIYYMFFSKNSSISNSIHNVLSAMSLSKPPNNKHYILPQRDKTDKNLSLEGFKSVNV